MDTFLKRLATNFSNSVILPTTIQPMPGGGGKYLPGSSTIYSDKGSLPHEFVHRYTLQRPFQDIGLNAVSEGFADSLSMYLSEEPETLYDIGKSKDYTTNVPTGVGFGYPKTANKIINWATNIAADEYKKKYKKSLEIRENSWGWPDNPEIIDVLLRAAKDKKTKLRLAKYLQSEFVEDIDSSDIQMDKFSRLAYKLASWLGVGRSMIGY